MDSGMYKDREDAGRQLAQKLVSFQDRRNTLVLGLPRGGAVVAAEMARVLHLPWDVFLVRKLGVPGQEELAMGAITLEGRPALNYNVIQSLRVTPEMLDAAIRREKEELHRRNELFRGRRPEPEVQGRTIILTDDGLATGATMRAAIVALQPKQPKRLVVAVPLAPEETCRSLGELVDEIVCMQTPEEFFAVGQGYEDFTQVTDEQVRSLLKAAQPD